MSIDDLTEEQKMIANLLYACDSVEEFKELMKMFDERERGIAQSISIMMIHEHIEETIMSQYTNYYPDAMRIINRIKNNVGR